MVYFIVRNTSLIFYLCVIVIACDNSLNSILNNGNLEFIDLSYSYNRSTMFWPADRNFEFTKKTAGFESDGSWYAANEFAASEHGGTHIDAPYHFAVDGIKVDEIPLHKLVVPLIVIDVSSMVNDNPSFVLYKYHLDYMINYNMGKPCLIIFKFGWSKYAYDLKKYLGYTVVGTNSTLNYPGVSAEVADWITTSYPNVVGIGVDVLSIDPGFSTDFPAHKITCDCGLYILENVKFDRPVPDHGCTAIVMPMNIANGTGAPTRLVAVCPKKLTTQL